MPLKRARLYDILALCTAIIAIVLDQWSKALVVRNMTVGSEIPFPIFGHNLVFDYIHNSGAAFGMLSGGNGSIVLAILIAVAILVVGYLYSRMLNTGSLAYKLVFGLILGGAFGNLIDRLVHSGYVVDFVSFRIPEINYYFAIFNVADACISVGVALLFIMVLFGGLRHRKEEDDDKSNADVTDKPAAEEKAAVKNTTLHTTENDG
ncbi:signal peptidase II [Dictyobacter formicarum]|uniref:Lipoprotein signal peptidase n=1 Tax=Dictyobacter formicarum TaxID=2778368 RepID=A0ABQ3VKP2_9CHLR|nr:signal peptidase II [Dictyobacter formicarum]GHO85923.1 lipoprotein signal peptidase [Dictyobacter formicarum]